MSHSMEMAIKGMQQTWMRVAISPKSHENSNSIYFLDITIFYPSSIFFHFLNKKKQTIPIWGSIKNRQESGFGLTPDLTCFIMA